ncbi:superoxide dismutase family protein [Epibacterium ulvae]|uniref:superoxide dismutase family protein n=1 Tax=Epibacterium ulvae TaxID=1156985 RepID=UPI002491D167|nr:superoxide dismutase family protein [Epibacterium ulvae]
MKQTVQALLLGVTVSSAFATLPQSATADHTPSAVADLYDLNGSKVGAGHITQTPHGVLVHIKVSDQPPGPKGVHFHSKAHCAADTGFKSSHGHHGEGEGEHGLLNAAGPGKGDLGNIYVAQDGIGEMQFFKTGVYLNGGDLPLLDADGTAIVIHANEDDQITQPIGGAGPRLVCGLLEAQS